MKDNKGRPHRVGELIRAEIATMLNKGVKDPRIGFVSVMEVRVSPDLQYANVYISAFGTEAERKSSLIGLRNAAGWIRRELGKKMTTRVTPEVRFFPDSTLDQVYHLEEVFESIHEEQQQTPMLRLDMAGLIEELQRYESFLVTSHVNPDGDAIGSVLGMAYFLRALGKTKIACRLHDVVPRIYASLPGAKNIKQCSEEVMAPHFDAVVVVDVAERERLGDVVKWIEGHHRCIIVDHHLGEGMNGAIGFTDTSYAATGEIIADLFEEAELTMTRDAAHALYVAQITDTGGFRFSNTNARSHEIAARFLETGLDVAAISGAVFDRMSRPKFELLRRAVERMEFSEDGRLAHTYMTAQDLDEAGAKKEDLDGIVNYARNVDGVQVGALFTGTGPETTKISIRCGSLFNAAEFLSAYGGGGHAPAAGATVQQPLHILRDRVVAEIIRQLPAVEDPA